MVNKTTETPRISLLVLGAVSFMVMADMKAIDPLLRIIANEFGSTVGNTAAIISAYTIPYGLFQLVYGPLGDRIGKLKVMTRAIVLFAIGTILCGLAPTLPSLILLRFLTGMVAAAIIPLSLAYLGDSFPYAERQTAIGRYLSALMLGQIMSSTLGGIFGEYLSWREIFWVLGVASLGVAIVLWRAVQKIPVTVFNRSTQTGWLSMEPYLKLMARPNVRLVITAVFIEGFFLFGSFAYIGAFIRDRYGLPYTLVGLLLTGFGIGGLIYSITVKWLVRRLGERGLVLAGGSLIGLCYGSIAWLHQWTLLIPGIIVIGLGLNMLHSTLQTKATELAPESRGTAVSLFAFSLFLGQGIGSAFLGKVVDGIGYHACFTLSGIVVFLLAIWFANQLRLLKQLH
ncbi:MFS transporter [Pseudanabaena sp. UWO310]|uniref:MFS transporter n=1 Tax=Pseudanabaena sp. UWO310 TaxID=2480795 RepID=UPI001160EC30|nr:MFS transporter [Pseudanabaena sp. UWO310]TYQ24217.1 MFS transporter [Pseudanabaena sp. UWO310]